MTTGPRTAALLTTTGTFISQVATFVMRIAIARALGPGPLGTFSVANGYLRIFGQVADAGLHYALLRKGSNDPELISRGISLKVVMGLGTAAAAATLGFLSSPTHEIRIATLLGALGVAAWSQLDIVELWFRSRGRFDIDLLVHGSSSVLRVAFALAALALTHDPILSFVVYFAFPLVYAGLAPRPWRRPGIPRELIGDSASSLAYRSIWNAWLNVDVLVLAAIAGVASVGRYEAARSIAYSVLALSDAAAVVVFQRLGAGEGEPRKVADSLATVSLIGVALSPVASLTATFLLPLFFGPEFGSSDLVLTFGLLLVGYLLGTAGTAYASSLLYLIPRQLVAFFAAGLGVAFAVYTLAAPYGLVATALAVCLLQAVSFVILFTLSRRFL